MTVVGPGWCRVPEGAVGVFQQRRVSLRANDPYKLGGEIGCTPQLNIISNF